MTQSNLNALSAFADVAEEYCALIDSLRDGRPSSLYRTMEALLPRLHLAILPVETEMASKERPEFEKLAMTHDQWRDIADLISATVAAESGELVKWHEELGGQDGRSDDYCATRVAVLWDDLADIYRGLLDGLNLWKIGTADAQAEASWEWRYNYEIHWGDHLFRAMTTVHEARYHLYAD